MNMKEQTNVPDQRPPASGNIWGWKFSLISLGIILFMVALAAFRHWQLGVPVNLENVQVPDSTEVIEEQRDTLD
ncbi:MAG: hypothetical protein ACK4TA_05315 [Saprospiraceae bacterium]